MYGAGIGAENGPCALWALYSVEQRYNFLHSLLNYLYFRTLLAPGRAAQATRVVIMSFCPIFVKYIVNFNMVEP